VMSAGKDFATGPQSSSRAIFHDDQRRVPQIR
jgi:hypothetical protein